MKRLLIIGLCGFMFSNVLAQHSFWSDVTSTYQSMEQARKQRLEERYQQRQDKLAAWNARHHHNQFNLAYESQDTFGSADKHATKHAKQHGKFHRKNACNNATNKRACGMSHRKNYQQNI